MYHARRLVGIVNKSASKLIKASLFVWLIPHYLVLGYINLGCD